MSLAEYKNVLDRAPGLIQQSIDWRIDHILDNEIPLPVREQWLTDVQEVLHTMLDKEK